MANEKGIPERRIAFLETCFEVFCKNGLERTSLKMLAEACGVTNGNLLYYFDKQRWYHRSYSAFGLFHRRRLQMRASDTGARAMTACPGEPARIGVKNCLTSISEAKARASTVRPKIIPGRMTRHDRRRKGTFIAAPWRGDTARPAMGRPAVL